VVNHAAITALFDNGQCTEWAAQRRPVLVRRMIEHRIASEVRRRRPELLPNLPARYWAIDARSIGVPTGTAPKPGALIVFQPGVLGAGQEGHIAYVERVYQDGFFVVSQMNAPLRDRVTYQTLPRWTASSTGVRFIYRAP